MSSVLSEPEKVALAEADFHLFNLAVWEELCDDTTLSSLDYRIETDRYGQIIMSPPPAPSHGNYQSELSYLLRKHSNGEGRVISECPVSTTEGVKAADNAWCSTEIWDSLEGAKCFLQCPEILVEIVSPSNTKSEIEDKKKLYFNAGAKEVWLCDSKGSLVFYLGENNVAEHSSQFPDFPNSIA